MDPLSTISGITGIVAVGLHTAQVLIDFLGSIKDAPTEISEVTKEAAAVSEVLTTLEQLRRAGVIRPLIEASLTASMRNCIDCMSRLKDLIQPYAKPAGDNKFKWRYVGWTLKKTSVKEYVDRLQQAKLTLSLSISIINTYAVETGNTEIRKDIGGLRQQLHAYDADKVNLASVRGGAPGSVAGTDVGLPLRRYLEHLSLESQDWIDVDVSNTGDVLSNDAFDSDPEIDSSAGMKLGTLDKVSANEPSDAFFHEVFRNDHVAVAERVAKGIDLNKPFYNGYTPLHICALQNHVDTAKILINAGANLHALGSSKPPRDPLWLALDRLSMGVAALLMENGQDPGPFVIEKLPKRWLGSLDQRSSREEEQSQEKRLAVYKFLASIKSRKAVVDRIASFLMPSDENRDWSRPDGVAWLRHSIMNEVLTSGLNPDESDEPGFTALHYATFAQQIDIVRLLLRHKVDPDIPTPRGAHMKPDPGGLGLAALQIAAGTGNVPLIKAIIEGGADVNLTHSGGGNALQIVGIFSPNVAQTLLDAGADINNCNHDGYNILHWAAICCNAPLVDFLIQRGLNVDVGTRVNTTALHFASMHGFVDVVQTLLRNGATVNATDLYGRTALHNAVRGGHLDVRKILIDHGAVNYYDTMDETPYMAAKNEEHDDLVETVEQRKVDKTSKEPGIVEEVIEETGDPQKMNAPKLSGPQLHEHNELRESFFLRTQDKGYHVPARRPTF